jgi:glycosyltransferase involved in cell wall biosynthesis
MRIVHIITGLNQGGAEAVFLRLLGELKGDGFETYVISLTGAGYYSAQIEALDVTVHYLNFSASKFISTWRQLSSILKQVNPDVVQTWMYHADLLGGIIAKLSTKAKIIWNVRNGNIDPRVISYHTWGVVKFCAVISHFVPDKIICCSFNAAETHVKAGYSKKKFVIIPNGIDINKYVISAALREKGRSLFNGPQNATFIGNVSRWHPLKDHKTLLSAFAAIVENHPDCLLVLVGKGLDASNEELNAYMQHFNIRDKIILMGPQANLVEIMNGFDLHVLSSVGEAFPNVVAETMACGVPNVVTNAGDAAKIVGNLDVVVPVQDHEKLAVAIGQELARIGINRHLISQQQRERIVDLYSLKPMVENYKRLWREQAL